MEAGKIWLKLDMEMDREEFFGMMTTMAKAGAQYAVLVKTAADEGHIEAAIMFLAKTQAIRRALEILNDASDWKVSDEEFMNEYSWKVGEDIER